MDEIQVKHVIEAALLAAGRPLTFDTLISLFSSRGSELDKETLARALDNLAEDYRERGLELKEVASGYRIQIRSSMSDWLTPLWEERAPRYTRALLETLSLICYRQPITRAEIEEVRGVAVSTNIIRTLVERNWIRVVGHRDVPGKPAMFGTTRDFLDYFGLKKLEDLPALVDIKDGLPELSPQTDFLEVIQGGADDDGNAEEQEAPASDDGAESTAEAVAATADEPDAGQLESEADDETHDAADEAADRQALDAQEAEHTEAVEALRQESDDVAVELTLSEREAAADDTDDEAVVLDADDEPFAGAHDEAVVLEADDEPFAGTHDETVVIEPDDEPFADTHDETVVIDPDDETFAGMHDETVVIEPDDETVAHAGAATGDDAGDEAADEAEALSRVEAR